VALAGFGGGGGVRAKIRRQQKEWALPIYSVHGGRKEMSSVLADQ
jgi:hypothetical protein